MVKTRKSREVNKLFKDLNIRRVPKKSTAKRPIPIDLTSEGDRTRIFQSYIGVNETTELPLMDGKYVEKFAREFAAVRDSVQRNTRLGGLYKRYKKLYKRLRAQKTRERRELDKIRRRLLRIKKSMVTDEQHRQLEQKQKDVLKRLNVLNGEIEKLTNICENIEK